jgi:FkbM family methyltransferase
VELHNIALGNTEGIREFHIDSRFDAFSTSGFKPNAWNGKQSTTQISVKTEKLSKYIKTPIDLTKMDIEGAEKEVLMELEQENKLKYIKNIIIESHSTNITDILTRNGFEIEEKPDEDDKNLVYILGKNITKKST